MQLWSVPSVSLPSLPDISCCCSLSPGMRNGARAVMGDSWAGASAVKRLLICSGKTDQGDQMDWGLRKTEGKAGWLQASFPRAGSSWFPVWRPKSSAKGPFMSYIHTWQEPASPCAGGTQMKKHGREGAESGYWTWKWHFHFPLILNDIADFYPCSEKTLFFPIFSNFSVFHILKFMTVKLLQCTKDFWSYFFWIRSLQLRELCLNTFST